MTDGLERRWIMGVHDQPGDLVRLVRNDRLGEEGGQRQVGEGHLGRDALLGACRRQAGQLVPGPLGRGLAQQDAEIGKLMAGAADGVRVHGDPARG
jgi:hypothetical protein